MGPFFIHLLLMALLLQHAEGNEELRRQKPPKHDEAEHHQEFCLRIPEAPRSTSSVFETPQPTKLASKPKPARNKPKSPELPTQQPRRTKQPDVHRSPSEEENYSSAGDPEIVPMIVPIGFHSPDGHIKVPDGCHCKEQNKKPSIETYQVRSLIIRYPSETCRTTEYIEILKDGRKVCATQFSLVAHFFRLLSKPVPEERSTESPEISSTQQSTTAETSTSTRLIISTDEPELPLSNLVEQREHPAENLRDTGSILAETCIRCKHLVTWNIFDLKDVQMVDVNFQSPNCPAVILMSVRLIDGRHICMDSLHPEFQQLLDKLEIKEP